ncbi:MAG: glycosyltransferase [Alphaproteobacteria bacterium]|nr:glycosyltransferase [Alphaproteobacteria bacterium]
MPDPSVKSPTIRVGALVDLHLSELAGGHVKCWERLAEAAAQFSDYLDLTVHFSGDRDERRIVASNVRFVIHRPVLSTARVPFLGDTPDHTDLAPRHAGLRRQLPNYDVIHATDAYFAFAKTARAYAHRRGVPLVSSTHTDTPKYTSIFTRSMVERLAGPGYVGRYLLDRLEVHERAAASMSAALDSYISASTYVLASSDADHRRALKLLPESRVGRLRRGIDKDYFHPKWRDRAVIRERFGISPDQLLVLYVGRVDASKNAMVLARAVRLLVDEGLPIHAMFIGRGSQRGAVRDVLGERATLPGPLSQADLRVVYASADLFVFPSTTELTPNVVVEAKASGLPIIVSSRGGSNAMVARHQHDGLLVDEIEPRTWADAIKSLGCDVERRRQMAERARQNVELTWPSWSDVLRQDLLPVWNHVANQSLALSPA